MISCRSRRTSWVNRLLLQVLRLEVVVVVLMVTTTVPSLSAALQEHAEAATTTFAISTTTQQPPVIGVVSQPLYTNNKNNTSSSSVFYIAASYIKWLESGGARTIAIPYDATPNLLDELLTQIHMLFLPGGDAPLAPSIQYLLTKIDELNKNYNGAAVEHHHDKHSNHSSNHTTPSALTWFPIWGTCLGFEFMIAHFGGFQNFLKEEFDAENMSLPLYNVVTGITGSNSSTSMLPARHKSLYSNPQLYDIVTTRAVTLNNHQRGISPKLFRSSIQLTKIWYMTSTNVDRNGKSFVSTIEPIDLQRHPYYGVQYHPEKNAFEYGMYPHSTIPYEAIDHSSQGVRFSNLMARYVVKLARLSQQRNYPHHQYTQPTRFPPVHTYPIQVGIAFEQIYLIPPASHFDNETNETVTTRTTDTSSVTNNVDLNSNELWSMDEVRIA